jgi:hypothetical protein
LPRIDGDESFHLATLYGSIFPAVWNFQLALHTRGYGTCVTTLHLHHEDEVRQLLGIPPTYVQGALLPVGRLRSGHPFSPAVRRPLDEVVAVDNGTVLDSKALDWAPSPLLAAHLSRFPIGQSDSLLTKIWFGRRTNA